MKAVTQPGGNAALEDLTAEVRAVSAPAVDAAVLEDLTAQFLASYRNDERARRIARRFLPSREAIVEILELVLDLMYPGYFGRRDLNYDNLDTHVAKSVAELAPKLEAAGIPYAPIVRPEQLLDDPHLKASGGLVPMQTDDGGTTDVVLLPITMGGRRPGVRQALARVGEHTQEVLSRLKSRVSA